MLEYILFVLGIYFVFTFYETKGYLEDDIDHRALLERLHTNGYGVIICIAFMGGGLLLYWLGGIFGLV